MTINKGRQKMTIGNAFKFLKIVVDRETGNGETVLQARSGKKRNSLE